MARTDYYGIQTPVLQATSQAIRTVNGTVGTIAPEDYPDLISAMKSGTDYDNVMAQLVEETTTPASIASFTDGANNLPVKELICTINPTETGSGAKSPQNPYVIGGHTGINVAQTGVNIWDEQVEFGAWNDTSQKWVSSNTQLKSKNLIPILPNTTYRLKNPSGTISRYVYYDKDKNYLSWTSATSNASFTTPVNAYYMLFGLSTHYGTTYNHDVSINYPSTDTAYHAYNGHTHHADFGQTVYGGTLNVTTGVLTLKRIKRGVSDLPFVRAGRIASSGGYYFNADINLSQYDIPQCKYTAGEGAAILASELFNMGTITNPYSSTSNCAYIFKIDDNRVCVRVGFTDIQTLTDFDAIKDDIEICYELATPTTIQLDPIEVRTLLGANNLYHDCNGNIKVTYRANGALYVAQH